MRYIICFSLSLLLAAEVNCHLSCRLTDDQNGHDDVTIRGGHAGSPHTLVGPPGKQGPRGHPGESVCCKPCDTEELSVKVTALEEANSLLRSECIPSYYICIVCLYEKQPRKVI